MSAVQEAHDRDLRRLRSPGSLLEEGLQQLQQPPNSRRRRLRPRLLGDAKDSEAEDEDQTLLGGADAGSTPTAASDGLPQGRRKKRSLRSGLAGGATRGSIDDLEVDNAELAISEADLHRGPPLIGDDSVSRFLASADFRDGTAAVTLSAAEASRFLHQAPPQSSHRLNFLPARHSTAAAAALPRRLVYVESAASGLFHRLLEPTAAHPLTDGTGSSTGNSSTAAAVTAAAVHRASLGAAGDALLLHTAAAAAASKCYTAVQPTVSQGDVAVAKGDALLASVWAFCQGLLAGVALLPLFQAHMAFTGAAAATADGITASTAANIGRAQFLLAYQAAANETRRLLFVLSALGFTGAIDLCAQVLACYSAHQLCQRETLIENA
jgi:hypothetical protein